MTMSMFHMDTGHTILPGVCDRQRLAVLTKRDEGYKICIPQASSMRV